MTLLELAQQAGINPKWVAGTAGGEYHSACPLCGGTDRFYIQPNKQGKRCIGYYVCRRCAIYGDTISFCIDIMGMTMAEALNCIGQDPVKLYLEPMHINAKPKSSSQQLIKPPDLWISKAAAFVGYCHQQLLSNHIIIDVLEKRGIPIEVIKIFKLGFSDKDWYCSRTDWGLQEELNETGNPRKVWLPKGIVIPTLEKSGLVVRIKIRRTEFVIGDKFGKYIAVSSSMNGLNIYGDTSTSIMVVVESELDAIAVIAAAGSDVFAIAIGGCKKDPDNVVKYYAENKRHVLIIPDNDDAGMDMPKKWQSLYSSARERNKLPEMTIKPTPCGKDIGEAYAQGLKIREFILNMLPEDCLNQSQAISESINEAEGSSNIIGTINSSKNKDVQTLSPIAANECSYESLTMDVQNNQSISDANGFWTESDHLDVLWVAKYYQKLPRPANIKSMNDMEAIAPTLKNQYQC